MLLDSRLSTRNQSETNIEESGVNRSGASARMKACRPAAPAQSLGRFCMDNLSDPRPTCSRSGQDSATFFRVGLSLLPLAGVSRISHAMPLLAARRSDTHLVGPPRPPAPHLQEPW